MHLYDTCFDFVDGTIAHICRSVLSGIKVVYTHHTRVHCVKLQSVVLPKAGLSALKGNGKAEDMAVYYAL